MQTDRSGCVPANAKSLWISTLNRFRSLLELPISQVATIGSPAPTATPVGCSTTALLPGREYSNTPPLTVQTIVPSNVDQPVAPLLKSPFCTRLLVGVLSACATTNGDSEVVTPQMIVPTGPLDVTSTHALFS